MITLNKTNNPICNIYNEKDVRDFHLKPSAEPRQIYYFDRESRDNTSINLENSFVLPYTKDKFFRFVISGASGSGKTTLLSNIITQFMKENNNNCLVIYLSSLDYDTYLDQVFKKLGKNNIIKLTHRNFINNNPLLMIKDKKKDLNKKEPPKVLRNTALNPRLKVLTPEERLFGKKALSLQQMQAEQKKKEEKERLNEIREKIMNTPFINLDTLREFIKKYYDKREVLMCFDDFESMPNNGPNKIIKSMIMELQHSILTAGRKHKEGENNINYIGVIHNIISADMIRVLRTMLNETNYLCISLKATSKGIIDKICDKYGLLQFKETLQDLKSNGVGWIFISVQFPFYILCDKRIVPIV